MSIIGVRVFDSKNVYRFRAMTVKSVLSWVDVINSAFDSFNSLRQMLCWFFYFFDHRPSNQSFFFLSNSLLSLVLLPWLPLFRNSSAQTILTAPFTVAMWIVKLLHGETIEYILITCPLCPKVFNSIRWTKKYCPNILNEAEEEEEAKYKMTSSQHKITCALITMFTIKRNFRRRKKRVKISIPMWSNAQLNFVHKLTKTIKRHIYT